MLGSRTSGLTAAITKRHKGHCAALPQPQMTWFRRIGVSAAVVPWSGGALEGRCWQRPGSRKRLPSKNFSRGRRPNENPAKLRDLRCKHCKEFEAADRTDRGIMPDQESPRKTEPKNNEGTILRCPTPLNRRAVHPSLIVILPCLFPATNTS
jgi:hypothetical protein